MTGVPRMPEANTDTRLGRPKRNVSSRNGRSTSANSGNGGIKMANPKVAMKAELEAKYKAKYDEKLKQMKAEMDLEVAQIRANHLIQLDMALQQSADGAMMAIDDVFDVNEYSAEKFHVAHVEYVNQMARLMLEDYEDDKTMIYTKTDLDRRLKQIVGEKNFQPWDDRYVKDSTFYVPAAVYYELLAKYKALIEKEETDG
jgi:hypothetical protein